VHAPRRRAQGAPAELRRRDGARARQRAVRAVLHGVPRTWCSRRDGTLSRAHAGRALERRTGDDPDRFEEDVLTMRSALVALVTLLAATRQEPAWESDHKLPAKFSKRPFDKMSLTIGHPNEGFQ